MDDILSRVAAAPITWGVDGSPGWGHLMDSARVLAEMHSLGLSATEVGPVGYLGSTGAATRRLLDDHGLRAVGGFVPAVMHSSATLLQELERVRAAARELASSGSRIVVLGATYGRPGYEQSSRLDDGEWALLLDGLHAAREVVAQEGLVLALHPHWGMTVESNEEVLRLLAMSDIPFCLDTGHMYLGGVGLVDFVRSAADRIVHVHLKDVDSLLADQLRASRVSFHKAVMDGLFRPLGQGQAGIQAVIDELEAAGYRGWYVLEQDIVLESEPALDRGPIVDAAASLEFLRGIAVRRGEKTTRPAGRSEHPDSAS